VEVHRRQAGHGPDVAAAEAAEKGEQAAECFPRDLSHLAVGGCRKRQVAVVAAYSKILLLASGYAAS
jgi:hypothetical protein